MDDDSLKKMFAELKDGIHGDLRTIADDNLRSHEETRKTLHVHGKHIRALWKQVRGSDPPPNGTGPNGSLPPTPAVPPSDPSGKLPLDEAVAEHEEKVSEHDLEIEGIHGQLKVLEKRVGEVADMNRRQNKHAGVDSKGLDRLMTSTRLRSITTLVAAATGLATVAGACYSSVVGRPIFLQPPSLSEPVSPSTLPHFQPTPNHDTADGGRD